jgi:hypothetical protein
MITWIVFSEVEKNQDGLLKREQQVQTQRRACKNGGKGVIYRARATLTALLAGTVSGEALPLLCHGLIDGLSHLDSLHLSSSVMAYL